MYRYTLLLLIGLCLCLSPRYAEHAAAQPIAPWLERNTNYFSIIYTSSDEDAALHYASWVDTIYEELALRFTHRTLSPLALRLYPTSEHYYQANPAARNITGVVAHADFQRRELVVIVERTASQSEEELRNNIRHELTHIIAADLSANRLNTGFQEGLAQYMEHPTANLEQSVAALRLARDQGLLMPWRDLDDRDRVYAQPEISYPQSRAIVAFLVDRYGFAKLREFLLITGRSSGYRSALERTYAVAPSMLETDWLTWLPGYLEGGYRLSSMGAYDLSLARDLLSKGSYMAAETELQNALAWMERQADTQPAAILAEARTLLEQSRRGIRATYLAERAHQALIQADYQRAEQLIAGARSLYRDLGDERQTPVLKLYAERVARGLRATERLAEADTLAQARQYPQARAAADSAAAEFAALGDTLRHDNALSLRTVLDQRQRLIGLLLLAAGLVGIMLSLLSRLFTRPAEIW